MTTAPARALRHRLLLAFGLIVATCAAAITYYAVHARQHVGADYTAMVADVVRSQSDPQELRTALMRLDDGHPDHRAHQEELGELLPRIPRRIENLRVQVLRSDLPRQDYAPLIDELDLVQERIATLQARFDRAQRDGLDGEEIEALRTLGLEVEAGLAWSYSELSLLVQNASAGQRHLMEWLTAAVFGLLVMVVAAVGAVMLMMLRLQRQRDELRHLSQTDMLTGLFNRRRLQEVAEQEFTRRQRHPSPLSLMLLDLDHFKHINDAFGHPVGDEVLSSFAEILRHQVRRLDTVARMGGEEFAVLLPDTDGQDARQLAERVREATRAMPLPTEAGDYRLTVSIGVTEARQGDSFEHLYTRADRRLYAAKEAGRDRVVSGDALPEVANTGTPLDDDELDALQQDTAR
ncbi:GGDEF domain-containing protein [Halomonas saccharevitans]|uniref:diguanylate cyclase n=1 Tax=Halomonas saccharevitans TaxID=416872 RepID=A0ABU3NCJ2_9GAMM|nr:GGDEF domain-containing protein [Halomonas saccharevitans]MDT8878889.1 GGDEF domain-containing protein [Halomonas saccharevitans]